MAFGEVTEPGSGEPDAAVALPTVTIVFLVYNRRDELRTSLRAMLDASDYPRDRVDVIVVDNASEDGSAEMVREEFPDVHLIRREVNCGVSAWNDGFAVARGEWVLVLDDDCYLPADGLRSAVRAAQEHDADLVSMAVTSSYDTDFRFDRAYVTGLLSFWGCAALIHRRVLDALGGYDPRIFVWANELEFTMRFYDAGFRHRHDPGIVAVHIRDVRGNDWRDYYPSRAYRVNAEHFAYIAAKLLHRRDAAVALSGILAQPVRDAIRVRRESLRAVWPALRGFARGLRHREPLRREVVSRTYRENFHSFSSPWAISRPLRELVWRVPVEAAAKLLGRAPQSKPPGRKEAYFAERARYYPSGAATLEM